jgi:hypothetical protein
MEAFEHVVKSYMESQGYIVSSNVKFPVKLQTKKRAYKEFQTHGYEVDVVAAREGSLVLGSVKSFLGSVGVNRQGFRGIADVSQKSKPDQDRQYNQYRIFNDAEVRNGIIKEAGKRYGYPRHSIRIALFVGKFKSGEQESIENHLNSMADDGVRTEVIGLERIVDGLMREAQKRTYINDPVIMMIKALDAAGKLVNRS